MPEMITAYPSPQYPGVVRVGVRGTAGTVFSLWRQDYINGPRHRVRGAHELTLPAGGMLQVYDTEAPLDNSVVYEAETATGLSVSSRVFLHWSSNRGLIRSVLDPLIKWMYVEIQDETGLARESRSSVVPVLGRSDPIVVGDTRRSESGTLVFLARSILDADRIVDIFQEGEPVLLRTPCTRNIRDKIVNGLGYREERVGKNGIRLCYVDFQTVGWPDTHPLIPEIPPGSWTYGDMRTNAATRYPTYGDIATPDPAESYFELSVHSFGP